MDEFGEYCQLLTLPAPPMEMMAGPDKSPEFARIANDGLAELVGQVSGPLHRIRRVAADEQCRMRR